MVKLPAEPRVFYRGRWVPLRLLSADLRYTMRNLEHDYVPVVPAPGEAARMRKAKAAARGPRGT